MNNEPLACVPNGLNPNISAKKIDYFAVVAPATTALIVEYFEFIRVAVGNLANEVVEPVNVA